MVNHEMSFGAIVGQVELAGKDCLTYRTSSFCKGDSMPEMTSLQFACWVESYCERESGFREYRDGAPQAVDRNGFEHLKSCDVDELDDLANRAALMLRRDVADLSGAIQWANLWQRMAMIRQLDDEQAPPPIAPKSDPAAELDRKRRQQEHEQTDPKKVCEDCSGTGFVTREDKQGRSFSWACHCHRGANKEHGKTKRLSVSFRGPPREFT